MKISKRLWLPLIVGLFLVSLRTPPLVQGEDKLEVLTTFYPVYYLTKRIAGNNAEVDMLLSSNQEPHDYEVSGQAIKKLQQADLIIYQDDAMEFFMKDLQDIIEEDDHILMSTQGIDLLVIDEEDDPHTWLDPMIYAQQGQNILEFLIAKDADNQQSYEENYQKLQQELEALDQEYREKLTHLESPLLVVQHEAFGYLAKAYDLEQTAITGLTTTQEPSAATIAKMQKFIKSNDIQTIFVDPYSDTAISETVASDTQAEIAILHTLEMVEKDLLADPQSYFKLMRENLEAIAHQ